MFYILLYLILFYIELHNEKTIIFQTSIYNYISLFLISNIFLYKEYSETNITIQNDVILNINLIIYLIGFCYYLIIKGNIETFKLMLKNIINKNVEIQQSTNNLINVSNILIEYVNKVKSNMYDYDLIDFGCGDCNTLIKLNSNNKIGIDYNIEIIKHAQENINKKSIQNIKLYNCDIIEYNFNNETIIYMYEPLWLCSSSELYYKLIEKIIKTEKEHYIIYISGLFVKHINLSRIRKYKNIKIIKEYLLGSLLLNRNVYLLKIN